MNNFELIRNSNSLARLANAKICEGKILTTDVLELIATIERLVKALEPHQNEPSAH